MKPHNGRMDVRRLRLLVELSRLGSMREVADELGLTTSTVSHQLATLAREAGAALVEPDGRRVRLTPAGRRLAEHATLILAAVDTARRDLDPQSRPAGTVQVGGFATAIRRSLLPVIAELADSHPEVHVQVHEYEPLEAFKLLETDDLDLALTYDYNLAPAAPRPHLQSKQLWSAEWGLGVPADPTDGGTTGGALDVIRTFASYPWIVNSRNTADEDVVRTLASMAGVTPNIQHRIDSLDLVQDLIASDMGVGLLPTWTTVHDGVRIAHLNHPDLHMQTYAVTRKGRAAWAPLRLLLDRLTSATAPKALDPEGPVPMAHP
jgi:DNA-binding transcriptional LysR family regulator